MIDARKRLKQKLCLRRGFYMEKKTVLIVDSDRDFAENLKQYLEKNSYSVLPLAKDGIDAIALCEKEKPEIVFLSENLPFLDGFHTAACLKSKGFSGIVLMILEQYEEEKAKKIAEYGADGCVVKPITEKFLIPWLQTKLVRIEDIQELQKEKTELLKTLEEKRLLEEACGILASSSGISIQEADRILAQKAEEGHISKAELAKILTSS